MRVLAVCAAAVRRVVVSMRAFAVCAVAVWRAAAAARAPAACAAALLCWVSAAQAQAPPGGTFIETDVQPRSPFVQQQALFVLRVFTTRSLKGSVTPLKPRGDVVVENLGGMKRYQASRNGGNYQVFEQRYLFFAQNSGELVFDPIVLAGSYIENNRRFNVREQSQAVRVTVRPAPPSFPGGWLPARSVELKEKWSQEPADWKVGDSLVRTLILRGKGVSANQLPEIEWPRMDDFNVYPDQARLSGRIDGENSTGERRRNIVLIPSKAGRRTLPAIRIPWWNTDTDRLEYAVLPARELEIGEGDAGAVVTLGGTADSAAAAPPPAAPRRASAWMWFSFALAVAWLATLAFFSRAAWRAWWFRRREGARFLRLCRARLKRACAANDARAAKDALIEWAALVWPDTAPATLGQAADLCAAAPGGDRLHREINALKRALYGGAESWPGQELWQACSAFSPPPPQPAPDAESRLAALHIITRPPP